ncbi:MAG: bile acid:sodium symporter family protein, partial [Myxococcales bacterium]|nr:bile acid:sodium symporter family protein [Myxococcales bacterium]
MGLSLTLDDFRRVVKFPKAIAVGVFLQMIVLPLIGLAVVTLMGMNDALAVGLMVLALSPGGVTSNMISFLARGDVALSVSLTAVVSLVTPFTIPLILAPVMDSLMGASQAIELPIVDTIVALMALTVVPVSIGMVIRRFAPKAAVRSEKAVKVLSLLILFVIIAGIMKQNWEKLPDFFAQTGVATLTLNVIAMAVGFFGARAMRLAREQCVTIGVEVGIQNGTTALVITGTLLANPVMSIAPAIYSLIM